ncbi:MAG: ATP-dependent DNA ligase, partial [Acidimicrobiia bacterium]
IHVFCRIEPNWEFPVVRRAALAFAREVERRAPKKVTTAWWKEQRGKRVFIDFNQNARDRTVASAYSVRARDDAAVSAPVTWDELPDVETEDFTMKTMPARFAELGDIHAGMDDAVCDLRVLLGWVERDEKEGLGEAAYPPNFPKMPGEPPRVQPSRARKAE